MPKIDQEVLDRDLALARSVLRAAAPQEATFDPEFERQLWRELQAQKPARARWWRLPVLAPLALALALAVTSGVLGLRLGAVGRELAALRSQLQVAQTELAVVQNLRWSTPELDSIRPVSNSALPPLRTDASQLSLEALVEFIRQSRPTILPDGQGGLEGHYDLGSGAVLSIPVAPDPEGTLAVRWSLGDGIFLSVPLSSGE